MSDRHIFRTVIVAACLLPALAPVARAQGSSGAVLDFLGLDGLIPPTMESELPVMVKTCVAAGYSDDTISDIARFAANSGGSVAIIQSQTRECRASLLLAAATKEARGRPIASKPVAGAASGGERRKEVSR